MNRNYEIPTVSEEWVNSHKTHMAVAVAIHAISDEKRSPLAIWKDPTAAEMDHVVMAVREYVAHGDFEDDPDGYEFGEFLVVLDELDVEDL